MGAESNRNQYGGIGFKKQGEKGQGAGDKGQGARCKGHGTGCTVQRCIM